MSDWIIYFGLLDFVLLMSVVIGGLLVTLWILVRRQQRAFAERWKEIAQALPQGVVLVQSDGQILLSNQEARQLWDDAPLGGRLPRPLMALVQEAAHTNKQCMRNVDTPSAQKLQVRAVTLPSGLALLTFQDLADRQRQELFYRNFISNVSHELKTPLTVIQGHVAAIGQGMSADDARQTSVRVVAQEAARLIQLMDNLLLLSRLEMPDFSLNCRPVNVEAIVEDAILQLSDLAEARDVSLGLQRESRLPRIMADRARLKQVFINLLDNAIKYNHPGGRVTVQLSAVDTTVVVQVADTGEGIPAEDLPHVFEKMYRVEGRRGRYVEGSGLGLSIVQRIVEQHHGSIAVDSRLGEGTTFTVTLPVQ